MALGWLNKGKARRNATMETVKKRGGDWAPDLKIENAEYAVLLIGPPEYDAERPDLEPFVHYRVGNEEKMVACIDDTNTIVFHDAVSKALEKRKIVLRPGDGCPVCEILSDDRPEWSNGSVHGDVDKMKVNRPISWWAVVPFFRFEKDHWVELEKAERVPSMLWVDDKVSEPLWNLMLKEQDALFDYDKVSLVTIRHHVEGTGKSKRHKWDVGLHSESVRKPISVPGKLREKIEECRKVGGSLDLHTKIAMFVRSRETLEQMLNGDGSTTAGDGGGSDSRPKSCYGIETEIDPTDEQCRACVYKYGCATITKSATPPDPVGETIEPAEGYEPNAEQQKVLDRRRSLKGGTAAPKTAPVAETRRRPTPVPEPEEDADGDPIEEDDIPSFERHDDEPEETEPEPPPPVRRRAAPVPEPEPEPEPEEEDEEQAEETPPPPPVRRGRPPGSKTAPKSEPEPDTEPEAAAPGNKDVDDFEKLLNAQRAAAPTRTVTRRGT